MTRTRTRAGAVTTGLGLVFVACAVGTSVGRRADDATVVGNLRVTYDGRDVTGGSRLTIDGARSFVLDPDGWLVTTLPPGSHHVARVETPSGDRHDFPAKYTAFTLTPGATHYLGHVAVRWSGPESAHAKTGARTEIVQFGVSDLADRAALELERRTGRATPLVRTLVGRPAAAPLRPPPGRR